MIERRLCMKATGVVRRIDNLGRVVIPKEIRKTLKISEGDSLEIFVEENGIILRKYAILDNLLEIAKHLVDLVHKIYGKNIFITDKEKIIACTKEYRSQYLNQSLSSNMKEKIERREEFYTQEGISMISGQTFFSCFFVPILVDSDALGSVILVQDDITKEDQNLIRLITSVLVKNIES